MSEILEAVGLKTCPRCEQTLPISKFGKKTASKDGLQSYCKLCQIKHKQNWRDENRDHVNEQYRQWCEENREQVNEYSRQRRQDPVEKRKHQVQNMTNRAIEKGILTRPDACPECGISDRIIEAHHWSYEPGDELDVIWLCPRCHDALHRRNRID